MCVFLGGHFVTPGCFFFHWHRFSPLHVWIGQEFVRLIALIIPVKFLIIMIHAKSLKNFLGRLFDQLSWKNIHFWYVQGLYMQNCLYKPCNYQKLTFFHDNWSKSRRKNFSGTSHVSYWSKNWRGWSGISIAPTLDRFRRVEATNKTNDERSNPVSRSVPLKKNAHFLILQELILICTVFLTMNQTFWIVKKFIKG